MEPVRVVRLTALVVSVLVAAGLTGLMASIQYDVATHLGDEDLWWAAGPIVVCLVPATLVPLLLRGQAMPRLALGAALAALVTVAVYGAAWAGVQVHGERLRTQSASFTCGDGVDPRVDRALADLPRPALVHGPIGRGPTFCTAGIDGGRAAFSSFRSALLGSGWRVVDDRVGQVVVRRGAVRVTLETVPGLEDVPILMAEVPRTGHAG
ncbi:hypothetical protein ACT8ZV_09830 [Nocardioides sp. MAHUQ-72]|uniref:hypothetical protein n=1 Tax=unclassified Nocardioides TaxID=2615069 RepID=UPI00360F50AA